jgi:hypothetical protein
MVEGMGWLMGLCSQPEQLTLGNWCKEFGVLPSQVKERSDWEFLAEYANLKNLSRNWDAWHGMMKTLARDPKADVSMPMDLIQSMLTLMDEAKERYG